MAARKVSRAAYSEQFDGTETLMFDSGSELSSQSKDSSSDEGYGCPDDPVSSETVEEDEHDDNTDVEIELTWMLIPNQQLHV